MSERFDDQSRPANPEREDVSLSDSPVTNRKSPLLLIVTMVIVLIVIVVLFVVLG
ncbi:hypothetical protein ACFYU5_10445 [Nocardia aobensis]|jgi:hypothetical protein|uniref:Cytoskeletal protein RodZ n=2 Tax=Nocardia TaxID=1817 RepID=A0ABU1XJF3_9NOCA|nr:MULTISPECIES: hypothetical protein [Nocardia]MDR7170127.1 cytoskeletal protein RodZ [Nocardia kruczakiae]